MMYREPKRQPVRFWWLFFGWNAFAVSAYSYWNLRQRGKDPEYDKLDYSEKYMRALGYNNNSNVAHIQLKGLKLQSISKDKKLSQVIEDRKKESGTE